MVASDSEGPLMIVIIYFSLQMGLLFYDVLVGLNTTLGNYPGTHNLAAVYFPQPSQITPQLRQMEAQLSSITYTRIQRKGGEGEAPHFNCCQMALAIFAPGNYVY